METREKPTSGWKPIVSGAAAAPFWAAIEDLAAALEEWTDGGVPISNLGGGAAGTCLFFAYLAEATGDDRYGDVAMRHLDRMIDGMPLLATLPGLYSGYTGPAWVLEHLAGRLFESEDVAESTREIDDALLRELRQGLWERDYDLISGLAGFAVYALEAWPRAAAGECLERVLAQLESTAEQRPEGVTWHTRPEWLPQNQRERFPRGYYNLGAAHGVPAVAAVLGALDAAGFAPARPLLERTMGWILARELAADADSCYPHFQIEREEAPPAARLAWCYGDPGVAASLMVAARYAGEEDWQRAACRAACRAAAREAESSGVLDAGLCHGAAGVGHLLNRLFQQTGEPSLGEAALFWLRRTLEMRRPGEGVAGYSSWSSNGFEEPSWKADPGFLTGAAGIGLALLAAVSPVEPAWDRVLASSLPPVNGRGGGGHR